MRPEKHQKIRRHQKHKHGKSGHGSSSTSKQKPVETTGKSDNRVRPKPKEPPDESDSRRGPSNETASARSGSAASNDDSQTLSGGERQSTFSRRKIESNWSRYGDIEDLENEGVTQRGADLGLLLAKEDDSSAQFRFQDEKDWQDDTYQQQEGNMDVLRLNVQSLVSQLQSLPISQRLNIDEEVFRIFEKDFGIGNISDARGILPMTELNKDKSQESKISAVPVENKKSFPVDIKPNVDFSKESSLKQTLNFSIKSQLSDKDKNVQCGRTSTNQKNPVETEHFKKSDVIVRDMTEDDDDELDFLLALDNPVKTQQRISSDQDEDDQGIETEYVPCDIKPDDGDLEDWLDSVLDD
ncbi:cell death regulator Aven-like [Anneissia japonica]|uniref:cell death regulator Aven-like n=1 Tax=Anneissia japonica TaxID=1529436 RepID=UPI00142578A4|nr:cell death regulator Aven-like [Anneissia japonica]